jgi:hypothetical protein
MPLKDPLDYIEPWPDETDFFICRFNRAYVAVLEGLIVPLFDESQWQGTPAQVAEMAAKARSLWQQVITPYEGGTGMYIHEATCLLTYEVAADVAGVALADSVEKQIPFSAIVRDWGIGATLESDGTVTLPAGIYQCSVEAMIYTAIQARKYLRVDDGVTTSYISGVMQNTRSAFLRTTTMIESDGETPIQALCWCNTVGNIGLEISSLPSIFATMEIRCAVEVSE